jgi:thioester reductase-like protein
MVSSCDLQALLSSPRNNMAAHMYLLESTSCRTVLYPREKAPDEFATAAIDRDDVRALELPTISELMAPELIDSFPWNRIYDEVADEAFLMLHTSGSTGNPKPVPIKHSSLASVDAQQLLPDIGDRYVASKEWANRRVYTALPPFHAAGWNFFAFSIFQRTELLFGPCGAPPSVSTVETVLKHDLAQAGVMAPSLLTEVAAEDAVLEIMTRWSSVTYGGGPLPTSTGHLLQSKLKVLQVLGSSETQNLPELLSISEDDWPYLNFHPNLGLEFRERMEGLHELVFVRRPEFLKHQGAFCTFPELDEYATKDLYEEHPHKPGFWKYRGRLDDIIVLSNGEKFNPRSAECKIANDSGIKAALIVGAGREQPALLVEPATSGHLDDKTRDSLISRALCANEELPAYAQIHPTHIEILEAPDTFLQSSKGEIRRAATIDAFKDRIEALYLAAGASTVASCELDLSNAYTLSESLVAIISGELLRGISVTEDDDFFDLGLDSLKVTRLLRLLRGGLRQQNHAIGSDLTPRIIYQNPSAAVLSKALMQLITKQCPISDTPEDTDATSQSMLDSYSSLMEGLRKRNVLVLTGSTGSLGSYFLDKLIRKRTFAKIICLNRRGGNLQKQLEIHRSRGLTDDLPNVQFFEASLADRNLGLSDQQYSVLVSDTTHIFHGAWQVNFNLPMSSFRSQLDGCYRLVELASRCSKHVAMTFISSVGAANHWAYKYDGPVPERALSDFAIAEPMGYAQSKLLAELLFSDANKRLGIPVTVCRVGQIAGPVKSEHGAWNSSEWFPSLILSAKALTMVPETLGAMNRIDWLPVDLLSDMLVEAISRKPTTTSATDRSSYDAVPVQAAEFLHFVNPHQVGWSNIVSELAAHMRPRPRVVSYDTWLRALANASEQDADKVVDVPAIKLLDFFQDIGRCDAKRPVFSTSLTEKACLSLRTCGPVSVAWIKQWMKQLGLDVQEGGGSSIEGVASNPSPLNFSGRALLVNSKANDMLKIPHQIDSGPVAITVARRSTRPVSTIA